MWRTVNSPRPNRGTVPRAPAINDKHLRARIEDEARRDAAAYFREFRRAFGHEGLDWLAEAWADINSDLALTADQASGLWLVYWTAFNDETMNLEAKSRPGP
jgi:hypothetical protein